MEQLQGKGRGALGFTEKIESFVEGTIPPVVHIYAGSVRRGRERNGYFRVRPTPNDRESSAGGALLRLWV